MVLLSFRQQAQPKCWPLCVRESGPDQAWWKNGRKYGLSAATSPPTRKPCPAGLITTSNRRWGIRRGIQQYLQITWRATISSGLSGHLWIMQWCSFQKNKWTILSMVGNLMSLSLPRTWQIKCTDWKVKQDTMILFIEFEKMQFFLFFWSHLLRQTNNLMMLKYYILQV